MLAGFSDCLTNEFVSSHFAFRIRPHTKANSACHSFEFPPGNLPCLGTVNMPTNLPVQPSKLQEEIDTVQTQGVVFGQWRRHFNREFLAGIRRGKPEQQYPFMGEIRSLRGAAAAEAGAGREPAAARFC